MILDDAHEEFKRADYVWCYHCWRAADKALWPEGVRKVAKVPPEVQMFLDSEPGLPSVLFCPYDDCDGDGLDAYDWAEVRASHPEYPTVPLDGAEYPW